MTIELAALAAREASLGEQRTARGVEGSGSTIAVEVDWNPDFDPESLEDRRGKRQRWVELLSVHPVENGKAVATLFVPPDRLVTQTRKVAAYLDPSKDTDDGIARGASVIQSIDHFRAPAAHDLWTDPVYRFPEDDGDYPWEVWLREGEADHFRRDAARLGIQVDAEEVEFPERTVVVAQASVAAMETAVALLGSIAELRAAPELDAAFHSMDIVEKGEWARELAGRIQWPLRDDQALCLLDSGVSWGHPLLTGAITALDCHAAGPWNLDDQCGHGTEMAGVACFGEELGLALETTAPWPIPFRLESVKVIEVGTTNSPLQHRGRFLRKAPLHPERTAPGRKRVFTLTITGDRSHEGRPTCWSAALDQLCAGWGGEPKRLVLTSAGNHRHDPNYVYPEDNLADSVQDPAQSWNAVTVGAITARTYIDPELRPGWTAVASAGDLSPHTTTGRLWDSSWPNKPDMVMEGGNMGVPPGPSDLFKGDTVEELGLLTTRAPEIGRPLLTSSAGTSPAAVLAGRYASAIQHQYPDMWPETIRALLIHSCRWSPVMFARCSEGTRRQKIKDLLRTYGYGSPDLNRALHSAGHALTLVVEDTIQPYKWDGAKAKDNKLRLHRLPWPEGALEALGETRVRLRATLSYFIEPGPGERGWGDRYRYPSHGLRFAVKTANETDLAFQKRISKAAREEGETGFPSDIVEWDIGEDHRDRGSIHSDVWEGPASKLTGRGLLAVFPVIGWWRQRKHLNRVENQARYALVVSVETDDVEVEVDGRVVTVDFYSEVEAAIAVEAAVQAVEN